MNTPNKCISFEVQPGEELLSYQYRKRYGIIVKTKKQIEGIRQSCRLAATVLNKTCDQVKPGITTNELNVFAHSLIIEANALPAALGYGSPPFPKSICTSINEVVCHGVPNNTPLERGDIVNIDVACVLNGYFGDCSRMVTLEPIDEEKSKVIKVSYECLDKVHKILKPGLLICEIAMQIELHAALHNCSVVRQFTGHGIGMRLHEPPEIPHTYNTIKTALIPGMIFAVEPIINAGNSQIIIDKKDHWTARTLDKKPSAQWEHSFLITNKGCEVLTQAN